jgi:aminopeptidase N
MDLRLSSIIGAVLILASRPVFAQTGNRIVLPTNVTPSHYDLQIIPDARAATFSGTVQIAIDVHEPTSAVVLNAAELVFSQVSLSGASAAPQVAYDAEREIATLTFGHAIPPGHHILAIAYSGRIKASAAGLFYLDYDSAAGRRRALFTQFENSDARRFFPGWDEPNRKATFTLTVTAPREQMAISNTPVAQRRPLPGGVDRVSFQTTPKMSTYLLFLGLGDFERLSRKVNGVEVGIVFRRGDRAKAAFALDAATHILPFYEDYFGVRYPLPKLDLIAGPGQSQFFGAMENWGAIFFFDRDLLVDPKLSTQGDRLTVYIDIAHEMSHQWFGDLVTMDWWDDLWLNEGFAEWMQYKATDHFHPEWHVWLEAQTGRERAMNLDSRAGTHPVIEPIRDVLQANQAFDSITYNKGMSVVRMLDRYVGPLAFRDGIRRYIKAHEYGNTVTDDLWRELDQASKVPVTAIAHAFTLQAGIPLIRVGRTATGIHLTQERFATDDTGLQRTRWPVPVVVRALGVGSERVGVVSRDAALDLPLPAGVLPLVNAGQDGYFRTLYAPDMIAVLAARFGELGAADQLGILDDTSALGLSGYEPLPDALEVAQHAQPNNDPVVLRAVATQMSVLAELYRDLPGSRAFQAYAIQVLTPLLAQVGWTARPNEGANLKRLRSSLLRTLGYLEEPGVVRQARQRFSEFLQNPDSLTEDLRADVLNIVAIHADQPTWEQLHLLARTAPSATEKDRYYVLLGSAHDPTLARRALDLTLTQEPEVTTRPDIIRSVSVYHPDAAFDFAVAHLQAVNDWLEVDSRSQFEVRLLATGHSAASIDKLNTYATAHIPPGARRPAEVAAATIRYRDRARREALPQIDHWLQARRPYGSRGSVRDSRRPSACCAKRPRSAP